MDTALSNTSEALQAFLQDRLSETIPFFEDGTMEVSLSDPHEMSATRQGLSVWLYKVVRDDQRLNALPRRVAADRLEPVPLPLRLHYLMTPITNLDTATVATRQTILGRVLQVLYDHPIFHGAELGAALAENGDVAVRLEPLPLDDIARVWEALDHPYQLSVSYEVSIVYIRTAQPLEVVHPVQVVDAGWGPASIVDQGGGF